METKSITNGINSSPIETSNDTDAVEKVDRQDSIKKKGHSCFEWIHLIAAIWIPVIIAIYAVIENNSSISIATSNRLKEIEIANISRTFEREIAEGNRLNEKAIAEQGRQKDRDLAIDQQLQNVLVEYHMFLGKVIIDHGTILTRKPEAKLAVHFMTLTALSQLDAKRKSILLRSLHYAKLITLDKSTDLRATTTIDLRQADLSNIIFGLFPNVPYKLSNPYYILWYHLWLPDTILTNASFHHATLACATFTNAIMISVDLSFSSSGLSHCSNPKRHGQTDFGGASLVNANLYDSDYRFTNFNGANLTFANMYKFYCIECTFSKAVLLHADLRFSKIYQYFLFDKERLDFHEADLSHAIVHSAHYRSISFNKSDWSNAQASQIQIYNCTFANAKMKNCSFMQSFIQLSMFRNASLSTIDLSDAKLYNVSFIDSDMRNANLSYIKCDYCDFTNVILDGGILKNASLRHSNFLNCRIKDSQLEEAIDLLGSTLPNGTVVKSNDFHSADNGGQDKK